MIKSLLVAVTLVASSFTAMASSSYISRAIVVDAFEQYDEAVAEVDATRAAYLDYVQNVAHLGPAQAWAVYHGRAEFPGRITQDTPQLVALKAAVAQRGQKALRVQSKAVAYYDKKNRQTRNAYNVVYNLYTTDSFFAFPSTQAVVDEINGITNLAASGQENTYNRQKTKLHEAGQFLSKATGLRR